MPQPAKKIIELAPQPGPQTQFMTSPADIIIYGGHAGGGKSYALLMEPLRHLKRKGFGAVIFRRKLTQVTNEGGMWDQAIEMYQPFGGKLRGEPKLDFKFPNNVSIGFGHLLLEDTIYDWHSTQIPLIGFDELTQFTKKQFFYMMTRNRSVCGVRPYIRATCNPDADSWVADFISWWWDPNTGYAIPERSGVLRWMIKIDDDINWFATRDDAIEWRDENDISKAVKPMSVTFIEAKLQDNPALISKDPDYESKLYQQDRVTRERLVAGNWKVRATGGKIFQRTDFEIVDDYPKNWVKAVRYWDFAGTEAKRSRSKTAMAEKLTNNPDWTCGILSVLDRDGTIYHVDMQRVRATAGKVERLVKETALMDGKRVVVWLEQEPGSSGKFVVHHYRTKVLLGYTMKADKVTGSKLSRAEPHQAYAESGNVKLVKGAWNNVFLDEHDAFPDPNVHDDTVDVGSGAYKALTEKPLSTTELMAKRGFRKK